MNDANYALYQGHYKSRLLIDTNLLLLLLLGRFDATRITSDQTTRIYTAEDYLLLELFIEPFPGLLATPNILTEVSNLSGRYKEPLRSLYFQYFAEQIDQFVELFIPSKITSQSEAFIRFGLTDASIFSLLRDNKHLVLTDDLDLTVFLNTQGFDAINFNHLRVNFSGF
ncbi:MAG: hypothetical protein ABI700_21435 [Chloroflexota bacterium]